MADHALSFGIAAPEYDRHRPRYPAEAAIWTAGGPPPGRLVDLGAGTGILTRTLLAAGYEVLPVEPDRGMRAQLEAGTPGLSAIAGGAENIPLPDHSLDGVVAGQAYHWFDPDRAHTEAARVLRPGGTFGVLWNIRDQSVPWVAALSVITEGARGDASPPETDRRPDSFGLKFEPVERAEFAHSTPHTPDSLLGMVRTRSYYLTASGQRQRSIDDAVLDLATGHPDLAGRESFELPYRTYCYRARRR